MIPEGLKGILGGSPAIWGGPTSGDMVTDPRHFGDEFCVASEGGLESGTTWHFWGKS